MANTNGFRNLFLLVLGAIAGGLLATAWEQHNAILQQQDQQAILEKLQAEVTHLSDIKSPASHPMVDVAMFAANLWFAGEKNNWPLANYYLSETRNRIQWEVRVNPSPKGPDAQPVDMKSIFDGIDHGSMAKLKEIIAAKDSKQFVVEYKHLLEDCYSCHQAVGRAYLRPMVPVAGPQPIVNLDPGATWPK